MPYFPPASTSTSAVENPNLGVLTSALTVPANSTIVYVDSVTTSAAGPITVPSTGAFMVIR